MHTYEKDGYCFHYNSDFSGDVKIVETRDYYGKSASRHVEVPGHILKEFVIQHVNRETFYKIEEHMDEHPGEKVEFFTTTCKPSDLTWSRSCRECQEDMGKVPEGSICDVCIEVSRVLAARRRAEADEVRKEVIDANRT